MQTIVTKIALAFLLCLPVYAQQQFHESQVQGLVADLAARGTITAAQQQGYIYGADTGTANAYAVTLSPAPTIIAGSIVVIKIANANTGASTLAVNGGTATSIKKQGSTSLASGDLAAGQIAALVFDGTNWQLVGISGGGSSGITQLTGDVNAGPGSGSQAATLASSGVTAGSYTSANITVDAKGRVTSASNGSASLYFGQGDAVASSGNNKITLGSTPLTGSLSVFVNGDILRPSTAYSASGVNVSLTSSLSTSDVVVANWATSNSTPGSISLSTVLAAPSLVQSTGAANSTRTSPFSIAFSANNTAGNDIVVMSIGDNSSPTVTDSQSNTYTKVYTSASFNLDIYVAKSIAGGANTVTITPGGGGFVEAATIHEVHGANATTPFDVANSPGMTFRASGSYSSGNITTTGTNDLLITVGYGSGTIAEANGWTLIAGTPASSGWAAWSSTQVTGTYSDSVSQSSAGNQQTGIAAFKP
ncbi:hypothetical protein GCM10011507_33450 [Edaphobacter acidisoli]|uniref:Uncharacterized protein n=1 Tax=Edaphobacter acidisoli TaxID=2040573 RepID=A0A916S0S5_9BACT|nr:hypothetical protein [Edaphobacter acidisoli]GGA79531.1 hypothetical protein GCM10011507_33450 [Edaphobacter acidisoli]